jgi:uncharacterized repeat protein (TIGR03803 family)
MNIRDLAALATLGGVALLQPVATSAATFTVLHSFTDNADGVYPNALIEQAGVLYGTTQWDTTGELEGTVFSINTSTGAYTVLHDFKNTPDGSKPNGKLLYANNLLYGTTSQGGNAGGNGTVFSIDPSTGKEKVLYSFAGASDGNLPLSLVYLNGLLYGATSQGGDANCLCGEIFSVNPTTGAGKVLYRFTGGTDGNGPDGDLAVVGTMLYGSTFFGGTSGENGTVFSFDTATNTETVLYRFQGGADGVGPTGGLIYQAGLLYGTTSHGGQGCVPKRGTAGCGTVFSVDPGTGNEAVIYRLSGMKGPAVPFGDVTFVKGSLYTTSSMGGKTRCGRIRHEGPYNCGTIFSVKPATGSAKVLLSFGSSPNYASFPVAGLVFDGTNFFGTTNYGGPAGFGTVFEFTP